MTLDTTQAPQLLLKPRGSRIPHSSTWYSKSRHAGASNSMYMGAGPWAHMNTSGLYTGTGSSTCPKCPGQATYRSPHVAQLRRHTATHKLAQLVEPAVGQAGTPAARLHWSQSTGRPANLSVMYWYLLPSVTSAKTGLDKHVINRQQVGASTSAIPLMHLCGPQSLVVWAPRLRILQRIVALRHCYLLDAQLADLHTSVCVCNVGIILQASSTGPIKSRSFGECSLAAFI